MKKEAIVQSDIVRMSHLQDNVVYFHRGDEVTSLVILIKEYLVDAKVGKLMEIENPVWSGRVCQNG